MWLSLSLGMAIASALIPVILLEAYVLGVVLAQPQVPWWALGLVLAIGQVAGKLLYFYAARGAITLPAFLRRKPPDPDRKPNRWTLWLQRFREVCERRPAWTYSIMLSSATLSLPPYAAIPIVAGLARVPLVNFVTACLIGRFVRFAALAAAPAIITPWIT